MASRFSPLMICFLAFLAGVRDCTRAPDTGVSNLKLVGAEGFGGGGAHLRFSTFSPLVVEINAWSSALSDLLLRAADIGAIAVASEWCAIAVNGISE